MKSEIHHVACRFLEPDPVQFRLLRGAAQPHRHSRRSVGFGALTLSVLLEACAAVGTRPQVATRVASDSAVAATVSRERGSVPSALGALGVTPFRLTGNDATLTALGFAIADLLTTDLSRSSQLQLVERARLGEVLQELDLAKSGRVDSTTAPRAGKLLGARRLVFGALDTLARGELRLSVRIADVETGVLLQPVDARAPLADVLAAEKEIAMRLFDALGVTLTPAERALVEARSTTSLSALNAYGRGVQAELNGDRRRALDEFQRAVVFDPSFQAAGDRAGQMKLTAQSSSSAPTLLPGVKAISAPVEATVDRLNRPLDLITSLTRPQGGPGDPAFPSSVVTVLITVKRP